MAFCQRLTGNAVILKMGIHGNLAGYFAPFTYRGIESTKLKEFASATDWST